jgi:hypothetical protein
MLLDADTVVRLFGVFLTWPVGSVFHSTYWTLYLVHCGLVPVYRLFSKFHSRWTMDA